MAGDLDIVVYLRKLMSEGAPILAYRSSDGTYQALRLDASTNAIKVIDYIHAEIHSERNFFYTDSAELNSAAAQDYLVTAPNTTRLPHFIFQLSGSAITTVQVYEGTDKTGTTLQKTFNNERNSTVTAGLTIHKGSQGGTTDGTLMWQRKSGASSAQSRVGMEGTHEDEIILKMNTKYIFRITSGTNNNLTNTLFSWYEHARIA